VPDWQVNPAPKVVHCASPVQVAVSLQAPPWQ
jgi:hypothetical protein